MAYTEADVERDGVAVAHGLVIGSGQVKRQAAFDALKRLAAAALDGAKVPGLERLAYIGEHHHPDLTWKVRADELAAQVATLTSEREAAVESRNLAEKALAPLGRRADVAESARDALRAQVEKLSGAIGRAETMRQALREWDQRGPTEGGFTGEAVDQFRALGDALGEAFAALSAPPVEMAPATERADNGCSPATPSNITPQQLARAKDHAAGDTAVGRDWSSRGCKCPTCKVVRSSGWKLT